MQRDNDAATHAAPMGHDQLFKQLLRTFFAEFLRLFDPETAAWLDLNTIDFRDIEAFTDIPQGERRTADLVAQVRTVEGAPELILIHVEIQREREAGFPWRMWQYYALLRQREGLPVIPIALVFYPGRDGIALDESSIARPCSGAPTSPSATCRSACPGWTPLYTCRQAAC